MHERKKILILSPNGSRQNSGDKLFNILSPILGSEYVLSAAYLSDLAYLIDGKRSRIWHYQQGWDVASFDLVIITRVGSSVEQAVALAHYLRFKSVRFIDSYLLTQGQHKLSAYALCSLRGLRIPRTFFASPEVAQRVFKDAPPFTFPVIVKANNGHKGSENYLVHSYAELSNLLVATSGQDMLIQEFVPNDGDMRLLTLAGKVRVVIHRRGKAGSHLHNTSHGGIAKLLPLSSISPAITKMAEKAAVIAQLEVAGVDIVVNEYTRKHYLLEVNRAPQLVDGAFTSSKTSVYATMVRELITTGRPKHLKYLIGRVEQITLPDHNLTVPARIDTGARTSSIWASDIHRKGNLLTFQLFDRQSEYFTGSILNVSDFEEVIVANSTGLAEKRFKVKLRVTLKGRTIKASFTLANRSSQVYPVLVGRNILRGKFTVDVAEGQVLADKEKLRTKSLRKLLR